MMEKRIVIVYYSWSGNTKKVAEDIRQVVGGDLTEITPVVSYPSAYEEVVEQGKVEIRAGKRPEICVELSDISDYDIVFIGSPNWWSMIAPPVLTFLEQYDTAGKIVVPFCTHGGGGGGRIAEVIWKECPAADVKEELIVYNRGNKMLREEISAWIRSIRI